MSLDPDSPKFAGLLERGWVHGRSNVPHTYRFVVTFEVDEDHSAFDDPEWAADAACGSLTNEYGLRAVYSDPKSVTAVELL